MPDPHVLYVVTAVVILGLVAWVVVVLSRTSEDEPRAEGRAPGVAATKTASSPPSAADPRSHPPSQPPGGDANRPKLDSHAEIRDDQVSGDIEEKEKPMGPNT